MLAQCGFMGIFQIFQIFLVICQSCFEGIQGQSNIIFGFSIFAERLLPGKLNYWSSTGHLKGNRFCFYNYRYFGKGQPGFGFENL